MTLRRSAPPPAARRPGPAPAGLVVPLSHPAMLVALILVAATILLTVTFTIFDPDIWQHLLVGRVIWQTHSVPRTQIWTWPTYGSPDITPSWLFRALLWPFWAAAGVWGLFAWRWLTTLLAFGLLWATGRRMGAHGFAALGVLLICALSYRLRSQVRPETLVAVLLALELWILESRRQGMRDHSPWIVAIAWVWVNAHISYYFGFIVLGVYLLDDLLRARTSPPARDRAMRLLLVGVGAAGVSFLNPFGWRAIWQPFDYFLHMRHEPVFLSIDELKPYDWDTARSDPVALVMLAWPLLILWRITRGGADLVGIVFCGFFTVLGISSRRFLGFYGVVAAPFVMRDLGHFLGRVPWPLPRVGVWGRAGALAILCTYVAAGEWARPSPAVGIAMDDGYYPIKACDFMAEHDVRGRMLNQFYEGGYLLYRFWPDRDRLPFLDIHQSGGPDVRLQYMIALGDDRGWHQVDRRFHFDCVLSDRKRYREQPILETLDADSSWALVFVDDAAALYLRRGGRMQPVIDRYGYRRLPAGRNRVGPLGDACARDSALRREVAAELTRAAASSPWNAGALSLLANIALTEGRFADARSLLERALKVDATVGRAHERLGIVALETGDPREGLRQFEIERAVDPKRAGISFRMGQAWRRIGDAGKAREWYRRELAIAAGNSEARDSLQALEGASPR